MSVSTVSFDDLALLKSAQRLVLQAQADVADEASPKLIGEPRFKAPLNLEALRRVVDDVSLSHQHLERVFTAREAVYAAVIERLSRHLDVVSGRLDALAKDVAAATARIEIKSHEAERAISDAQTTLLPEMENLLSLGRAYMTEAISARFVTLEEMRRLVSEISNTREAVGNDE